MQRFLLIQLKPKHHRLDIFNYISARSGVSWHLHWISVPYSRWLL